MTTTDAALRERVRRAFAMLSLATRQEVIFAAGMDHRIPDKSVGCLEPEPGVVCVVIKRARSLELTEDMVPYTTKVNPEELVDGVRERVMEVLAVGIELVVTTGPIWVARGGWRTPLRLLPPDKLDEAQVEIDSYLQTMANPNALRHWELWSGRVLEEQFRRRISGQPEYQWPNGPFSGHKEST